MGIRERLVEDAGQWHKWWSMRWWIISTAFGGASQAWPSLPSDWTSALPVWMKTALGLGALGSGVAGMVARSVKQKSKELEDKPNEP